MVEFKVEVKVSKVELVLLKEALEVVVLDLLVLLLVDLLWGA